MNRDIVSQSKSYCSPVSTADSPVLSVQFSHSVVSDSTTPWTAARQASLSITKLPELAQTHVHRVSDAIPPGRSDGEETRVKWWSGVRGDGESVRRAGRHCLPEDPSLKASSCVSSPMMTTQSWLTCPECPDYSVLAFSGGAHQIRSVG